MGHDESLPDDFIYSALIPAARITLPQRSVSVTMTWPYSAGVNGAVVEPSSANCALPLGSFKPALMAALSLSMISGGARRADAVPQIGFVARHEFADRRNIRKNLRALRGGNAERAQLAGPDELG